MNDYDAASKCPSCNGWGDERGTFRYCPKCGGSGKANP